MFFKLQLVNHHDALIDGTDLRALVASGAVLECDVVESIGCLIETLVGTFEPAQRALGAKVEAHDRTLILRRAPLECLIARLAFRAQFEMAFHSGNSGAFHELEPLRQNGDFVGPLRSFSGLHRSHRSRNFLIRFASGFGA